MSKRRTLATALLSLGLLGVATAADPADRLVPDVPAAVKGERCVEPLEVIRREHMSLLLHQRDRTVHFGERDTKHSLKGCLSCHTQKNHEGAFIPVNKKGQFCYECHAYTGVQMDCFGCHAATPGSGDSASSRAEP